MAAASCVKRGSAPPMGFPDHSLEYLHLGESVPQWWSGHSMKEVNILYLSFSLVYLPKDATGLRGLIMGLLVLSHEWNYPWLNNIQLNHGTWWEWLSPDCITLAVPLLRCLKFWFHLKTLFSCASSFGKFSSWLKLPTPYLWTLSWILTANCVIFY